MGYHKNIVIWVGICRPYRKQTFNDKVEANKTAKPTIHPSTNCLSFVH